jgi:hypothetical protein
MVNLEHFIHQVEGNFIIKALIILIQVVRPWPPLSLRASGYELFGLFVGLQFKFFYVGLDFLRTKMFHDLI